MRKLFTFLLVGVILTGKAQNDWYGKDTLYADLILNDDADYLKDEINAKKAELKRVNGILAQKQKEVDLLKKDKKRNEREIGRLTKELDYLKAENERIQKELMQTQRDYGNAVEQLSDKLREAWVIIKEQKQMIELLSDSLRQATGMIGVLVKRLEEANRVSGDLIDTKKKEIHIGTLVAEYKNAGVVCGFAPNSKEPPLISGDTDDYLKRLVTLINRYPNLKVILEGTCNYEDMDKSTGRSLALGRAEGLQNLLIKKYGLSPDRVEELSSTIKCRACNCVRIRIRD